MKFYKFNNVSNYGLEKLNLHYVLYSGVEFYEFHDFHYCGVEQLNFHDFRNYRM